MHSIPLSTGVTLQYAEHGDASGIPVVFLHGVTDSWRSFEGVLDQLPPTIRAIAVTQRGHGDSSRPDSGYRYVDMSRDLLAFMDALGLPAAAVAGHSMGSMVAMRFAIDYPARVTRLILMGAFATIHGRADIDAFWQSTISTLSDPIDPAVAREFQESTLARPVPAALLDTVVNESLKVPARVWQATFRGFMETPSFTPELARLTAPTLLVWGDRDAYATEGDQEQLRAAIPNTRSLVYAGAGHGFHWEDPSRFAADVASFATE